MLYIFRWKQRENKVVNIRNFIKVWDVVKGKNWDKLTK